MTTPATMVQITMDELVEFRSYKAKLKVLKAEYLKLQAAHTKLETEYRAVSASSPSSSTVPDLNRDVSAMLANVRGDEASTPTSSTSLSQQVEALTRQLQAVSDEKKSLQQANDELMARLESNEVEETLKKAQDEIDDLKRRLALANRDRSVLAEQAEAKREAAEAANAAAAAAVSLIAATTSMVEEVWENQRYVPLKGWVPAFLPTDAPAWSDECGKKKLPKKDDLSLPSTGDWKWSDSWSVVTPTSTDADGWIFSRFAILSSWRPKHHLGDGVRKRRWQRTRISVRPTPATTEPHNST